MAVDVRKVLASAIANAENNHNLDVDALVVAEASVGKSISLKRWTARARGRSSRIVKPFSRVRIVVREQHEAYTWVRNTIRSASGCRSPATGTADGTTLSATRRVWAEDDCKCGCRGSPLH